MALSTAFFLYVLNSVRETFNSRTFISKFDFVFPDTLYPLYTVQLY